MSNSFVMSNKVSHCLILVTTAFTKINNSELTSDTNIANKVSNFVAALLTGDNICLTFSYLYNAIENKNTTQKKANSLYLNFSNSSGILTRLINGIVLVAFVTLYRNRVTTKGEDFVAFLIDDDAFMPPIGDGLMCGDSPDSINGDS